MPRPRSEPTDLEPWALAIECTGRPVDAIEPLTRAVARHGSAGNRRAAANPALTLARIHLERGELEVAKGWQSRAADLIGEERESREYGLQCWMGSRLAAADSQTEQALALASEAFEIGKLVADPVVDPSAWTYRGFYNLCLGETDKGVEDQNLAAALGLSSDVDPVVGGTIYCNILWACRNFADWARANQWSVNYDRWCRSCGLDNLTGSCRLHRAEVLGIQGTLAEAEALVRTALDQLATTRHGRSAMHSVCSATSILLAAISTRLKRPTREPMRWGGIRSPASRCCNWSEATTKRLIKVWNDRSVGATGPPFSGWG